MSELLLRVLIFALLPVIAAVFGAAFAAVRPPGSKTRSIIQHFAAGVVFSVVAVELLPDVLKEHNVWAATVGFALGVGAMLGIKQFTGHGAEEIHSNRENEKISGGLLIGVGIDVLVDGFLLGIGFVAGETQGKLLALALTVELLSLGLAVASSLIRAKFSKAKIIGITAGLSSLILVGAIIGAAVLPLIPKGIFDGVMAFGLAALLFLVTEELLIEAHEEPETPLITSTFFLGFLIFLILGMIS